MKALYKLYHSVFACLALTTSVGMIYAFSLFIPEITQTFGVSRNCVQFAFSLSIFFLGTGAACFGNMVEKNIKAAAAVATGLFAFGLFLTHLAVRERSLFLLFAGTGVCMGLAEGIAYLCPVKNMVMWFSKSRFKGLIMAVSIVSFGLGATLCTFLYGLLYPVLGLNRIFLALCAVYFLLMSFGTLAIRKPKYAKRQLRRAPPAVDCRALLSDGYFLKHWLFMFLNISMGLILIGNRKNILVDAGLGEAAVLTVFAICGFTNAFGRLLFPFIGDFFRNKLYMIPLILVAEFLFISPAIAVYSVIPLSIILVEGGYGGMFAIAPQVLLSQYGQKPLSIVHGLLLSSWACAAMFAYFCALVMSRFTADFYFVTVFLSVIYALAAGYSLTIRKSRAKILKS